jgi:hypothetical protein
MKLQPLEKVSHSRSRASGGTDFSFPFVLTRHNIRAFLRTVKHYEGIYVFNRTTTGELVIAPERNKHKGIADAELGRYERSNIAAALINIFVHSKSVRILLHGDSMHFGQPTRAKAEQVTNHITELLKSIGVSKPSTQIKEDVLSLRVTIKFSLPDKA